MRGGGRRNTARSSLPIMRSSTSSAAGSTTVPWLRSLLMCVLHVVVCQRPVQATQAKLVAVDGATRDLFGWGVDLSADGSTALVGAYNDDDKGTDSGSVYVFERSSILAAACASGKGCDKNPCLDLAKKTCTYYAKAGKCGKGTQMCQHVIQQGSGDMYRQAAKLVPWDGAAFDFFGSRVALSADGSIAFVGAYKDDDKGTDSGSVYVFERSGGGVGRLVYKQVVKLVAADGARRDAFGSSVALAADGSTALVGAPHDDDDKDSDSGSVYVFERSGGGVVNSVYKQTSKLVAADSAQNDWFGCSVALAADGSIALVGAPADDNTMGRLNSGSVYVFERSGGVSTTPLGMLLTPSAACASNKACDDKNPCLDLARKTCTYAKAGKCGKGMQMCQQVTKQGSMYRQVAKLVAADGAKNDMFGFSVAVAADGSTALVGAYRDDDKGTDSGSVYVFQRSRRRRGQSYAIVGKSIYKQAAKLVAADGAPRGGFGSSMALAANGSTALVGAPNKFNGAVYAFAAPRFCPTGTYAQIGAHKECINCPLVSRQVSESASRRVSRRVGLSYAGASSESECQCALGRCVGCPRNQYLLRKTASQSFGECKPCPVGTVSFRATSVDQCKKPGDSADCPPATVGLAIPNCVKCGPELELATERCPGGALCGVGYTGSGCATCDVDRRAPDGSVIPRFFPYRAACEECPASGGELAVVVASCALIALVLIVFALTGAADEEEGERRAEDGADYVQAFFALRMRFSALINIVLTHLQLSTFFLMMPSIPWPPLLRDVGAHLANFIFVAVAELARPECQDTAPDDVGSMYAAKFALKQGIVLAVFGSFLLLYALARACNARKLMHHCSNTMVALYCLFFLALVRSCAEVFDCSFHGEDGASSNSTTYVYNAGACIEPSGETFQAGMAVRTQTECEQMVVLYKDSKKQMYNISAVWTPSSCSNGATDITEEQCALAAASAVNSSTVAATPHYSMDQFQDLQCWTTEGWWPLAAAYSACMLAVVLFVIPAYLHTVLRAAKRADTLLEHETKAKLGWIFLRYDYYCCTWYEFVTMARKAGLLLTGLLLSSFPYTVCAISAAIMAASLGLHAAILPFNDHQLNASDKATHRRRYTTNADALEYASLLCELGMTIVAAVFVYLGRTADTSSAGYVSALACALILTAVPVCLGLWFVCAELRHKTNNDELEDTNDNPLEEVKVEEPVAVDSNPLHAPEDN